MLGSLSINILSLRDSDRFPVGFLLLPGIRAHTDGAPLKLQNLFEFLREANAVSIRVAKINADVCAAARASSLHADDADKMSVLPAEVADGDVRALSVKFTADLKVHQHSNF